MPQIYDKKAAAKFLCISIETLDRHRKNGKLPYHKIGDRIVFTETDLTEFLKKCENSATDDPSDREKLEIVKAGKRGRKTPRKTFVKYEQGSPIYDYGVATLELSSLK